jgi:hypothetical protein
VDVSFAASFFGEHVPVRALKVPARSERLLLATLVGTAFFALALAWLLANDPRRAAGDFTYPWLAARALLDGREPYATVLAESPYRSALFYPLPAAFVAMPFAALPPHLAGATFTGIGFGWLTYHLLAAGRWRLLVLTAAPALFAVLAVQWSPLLTAAALSGPALALVIAKPTIGLALAVSVLPSTPRPGRQAAATAAGVTVLVALSLLVRPDWPAQWLAVLRQAPDSGQYRAPILTAYGAPVVLALLRWRRPEGRLLLALACVRQNGFLYDQLPLLLVPASAMQAIVLSGISHVSHVLALWHPPKDGSIMALNAQQYPFTITAMYLPCLVMVLRRPNVGRVPEWVERATSRWPGWLRGRAESKDDLAPAHSG